MPCPSQPLGRKGLRQASLSVSQVFLVLKISAIPVFSAFYVMEITVPSPPDLPPGRISPCDGAGVTRYMLSPGT